jgi:WD40 repeat protein
LELEGADDYVCSVRWIKEGNCLAVGNAQGEIALWDVEQMKRVRLMTGHTDRVGCLSWNQVWSFLHDFRMAATQRLVFIHSTSCPAEVEVEG